MGRNLEQNLSVEGGHLLWPVDVGGSTKNEETEKEIERERPRKHNWMSLKNVSYFDRLCVNNLTDSSMEVLAEELCKHKVVEILG